MITLDDYFGQWKAQEDAHLQNAIVLLNAANRMVVHLIGKGVTFPYNPATRSLVSGTQYGGYRPKECQIGAPQSAHKLGMAIDIYDPLEAIDKAIMEDVGMLQQFGLYIEHPDATKTWSHWSIKAPKSGRRVFYP